MLNKGHKCSLNCLLRVTGQPSDSGYTAAQHLCSLAQSCIVCGEPWNTRTLGLKWGKLSVLAEGTHTPTHTCRPVADGVRECGQWWFSELGSFLPLPSGLFSTLHSAHLHPRLCGSSAGACRSVTQIIEQPAAVTARSPGVGTQRFCWESSSLRAFLQLPV